MKTPRFAPVLAAALFLPGCFFARHVVPTDASGMEFPVGHFERAFRDQVARTERGWNGLPGTFDRHVAECVRNLTTDPGTFHEKEGVGPAAGSP